MIRGAACNAWAQGVDGLLLNQWFYNWPYDATFYQKLRELPFPEVMESQDKTYWVPGGGPESERMVLESGWPELQLPLRLVEGAEAAEVPLLIADDLQRWAESGQVHSILLRLRITGATELDDVAISLNGRPLPASCLRKINAMYRMVAPRYRVGSTYWWVYELVDAPPELWPVKGTNQVGIACQHRDPGLLAPPAEPPASDQAGGDGFSVSGAADGVPLEVRDVELEVQYLQGRNFHRGEDPALGQFHRFWSASFIRSSGTVLCRSKRAERRESKAVSSGPVLYEGPLSSLVCVARAAWFCAPRPR